MSKNVTRIKNLHVIRFRALRDIHIPFGDRVTVICGKNGTAKSTILGLLAQIFNFKKDYIKNLDLNFTPLHSNAFKSEFSEHFRLSEKFDLAGDLEAAYELYDAYFKADISPSLKFYHLKDRKLPRAIVRKNIVTETITNDSRNVTHPVIYLSLKRLIPIVSRSQYEVKDLEFLQQHNTEFIRVNNQLLCKATGNQFTSTTGSVDSAVVHSKEYDHEAVSAGEDNAGQIIQALFSFKKLKEEYPDYHGGLLLIDEADAGLFPGAQYQLKTIFDRYSKDLNLQIIFTTHSPILIEEFYQLSKANPRSYKTIYLSNKANQIQVIENFSWSDIYADISVKMKVLTESLLFPETNVYFEDDEARTYFNALVVERKVRKPLKLMNNISMGCGNYLELIRQKVPEFQKLSLLILDGDVGDAETKPHKNIVKLPGDIPPDQLLFEFFYLLDESDPYWSNKHLFTKDAFNAMPSVTRIYDSLSFPNEISGDFSLKRLIDARQYSPNNIDPVRTLFKNFFKSDEVQMLIKGGIKINPYRYMVDLKPETREKFTKDVISATQFVLTKNKGVASHIVETWYEKA